MVSRANRPEIGVGGHIATYASAASLYEVGFNHFFRGKRRARRRRPGLLPGPRLPRRLRPRLPRGPADRGPARRLPPGEPARRRAAVLPAPAAHAGVLGVPDRLDGPRPAQRDLPGALQPLPAPPRHQGHQPAARVVLPRRRRDGRARERSAPSASRPARSSTTSPSSSTATCSASTGPVRGNGKIMQELERSFRGAGWNVIKVVWGREWDDLLAQDVDGAAAQPDEHHARRPVPDLLGRERRLHPREVLRRRPAAARDGRAPVRRADPRPAARRPRLPQGLRRLRRRDARTPASRP